MVIPYIMNKFPISHDAYHELTQQEPERPRGYLIKGCLRSLDDQWEIETTGQCPGAELTFRLPNACKYFVNNVFPKGLGKLKKVIQTISVKYILS